MPSTGKRIIVGAIAIALSATVAACGSSGGAATVPSKGANGATRVEVGSHSNGAAKAVALYVAAVAAIRKELPAKIRKSGKLVIGVGGLPAGAPPLLYTGDDQKTLTGSEPDLGRLVAAVLGLEPQLENATWDNLFVGLGSGRTDVGFSNITDTEERKDHYDFASYRDDNLAFEVKKSDSWKFDGKYENLAGQVVAVGSGTNQERILLAWTKKLQAQGKKLTVKYFADVNSTYLALNSGRIDSYFAPNPSVAYHTVQDAKSPNPTRNAGTYSGAGGSLQGLIAATTKKGDGLVKPVADAINHLIEHGQYAKWLAAWNLSNEAVPTSKINPPGLPRNDS